jgi:hypothetical protein
MAISGKLTGSDVTIGVQLQDPSAASQLASVLAATGDGLSFAGLYAGLVQQIGRLLNAGGTHDVQRAAPGATGVPAVNTEGTRRTFSAGASGFTPVATPTDFAGVIGSATATVRVLRVTLSGVATAATPVATLLIKRSTANSGSTPVALTKVPHDSNNSPAPSCTVTTYTATNPTTGTAAGTPRAKYLNLGAAAGGVAGEIVWDFTTRNGQGMVLRGVAEGLFLNWGGAAVPAGTILNFDFECSEE